MSMPDEFWIRDDGDMGVEFTNDKGAQAQRYVSAKQYDALAAHVERLTTSAHRLVNELYLDDDEGLLDHSERMREAIEAVRAEPETSLARLKARWQAEALLALADEFREAWPDHNGKRYWIIGVGERLRRQDEGQPHSEGDV